MTFYSTAQQIARGSREQRGSHLIPILLGGAITAGAMALIAYLLWPTWEADVLSSPVRLPVSGGGWSRAMKPAATLSRPWMRS